MANSYTQIHIQFVFAVKYRKALIGKEWKERLHQYIAGMLRENKYKLLQINSMPDHIHIFIGMRPDQSVSSVILKIKTVSSKWIKTENLSHLFAWQEGYGAFSYAKSQVNNVIRYIQNQEMHHKRKHSRRNAKKFFRHLRLIGMKVTFLTSLSSKSTLLQLLATRTDFCAICGMDESKKDRKLQAIRG